MSEISREEVEQWFEGRGIQRYVHCPVRDLALRALSAEPANIVVIPEVMERICLHLESMGREFRDEYYGRTSRLLANELRLALPSADPRPSERREKQKDSWAISLGGRHGARAWSSLDRRKPTERAAQQGGRDLPAAPSKEGHGAGPAVAARPQDEVSGMELMMREAPTRLDAMVDRFLSWKLPKTFAPDAGISFTPSVTHPDSWPEGTNLFTAIEARQMLEHVLAAAPQEAAPQAPREAQAVAWTIDYDYGHETKRVFSWGAKRPDDTPLQWIPLSARPAPEGWVSVPMERTYDMRAHGVIAFNQARATGDVDDALEAAWNAQLASATPEPREPRK